MVLSHTLPTCIPLKTLHCAIHGRSGLQPSAWKKDGWTTRVFFLCLSERMISADWTCILYSSHSYSRTCCWMQTSEKKVALISYRQLYPFAVYSRCWNFFFLTTRKLFSMHIKRKNAKMNVKVYVQQQQQFRLIFSPNGDWIYNHSALVFSFPVTLSLSTRGYENQFRVNVIIKQTLSYLIRGIVLCF